MVPADRAPESEGPQRDRFEIKLVSMLAHNFRGSFVNIISLMDFYKKGQVSPDQFEDLFEELKATSKQHLASFEITLRWLKTQLPGFVYKPLAISASDSVRDAIRNNISEIERKKISLRVIGGNERWFFYADPELLGFVLNNLLNNAVKYSFPSGKIECIIGGIRDKNGTMVKVQIVDHGLGMDAKTRESLFCHDKTIYTGTEGEKGAGIALLICKEFIELQGGRIEDAIIILKLNSEVYPESFNVYDSLGEAYMIAGEKELAIENYKKSLELNPDNSNAVEMLNELENQ